MIFSIRHHRKNSTAYQSILQKLKCLNGEPEGLTEVLIKIPAGRYFTPDQIALISDTFSPLVSGQVCLQFGPLESILQFWQPNGYLSGVGAIHLFAHLHLAQIARHKTIRERFASGVIQERIYRPNPASPNQLAIVFTGDFKHRTMQHITKRSWASFQKLLALGSEQNPLPEETIEEKVEECSSSRLTRML